MLMRRRAASHARAARGVLDRARQRRLGAHLFDLPSQMAVLVRVVTPSSMLVLEELVAGLPSAVSESARREDRGEQASARDNRALTQADSGSAWAAGAGDAATLVRDACE